MKNRMMPEIRFNGFDDEWTIKNVGDFLTESRIIGTNGKKAKKLTVKLWRKGVIAKDEVYEGSEATQYYIRKAGQFIYGKLDFLNQAFGIIPDELDGYESTLDSPAYDISADLNKYFFLEYVSRKQFYLYNGTIADGSRRAKRIHTETFYQMPLLMPNISEQDKIGQLLHNIDALINLRQQELDNLKQMKQGLLQKMFPKEGEVVPEIRFPGFTDEWKKKKIEECFFERNERSAIGELLSVTINSGILKASDLDKKDSSSIDKSNYKKVEVGDIAYNSMRMWQGASGVSAYDGIVSPAYTVLIPKEDSCSSFFSYLFKLSNVIHAFTVNSQGLTSDTWNLKFPLLKEVEIMVPSYAEQKLLVDIFNVLDKSILLHQRELELLKETKKAFLQKMFI